MLSPRSTDGQASVELVALLPLVGLLIALAWQGLLAGEAAWLGAGAARAAARAEALGRDPLRAARAVLPARFAHRLRVHASRDGSVAVALAIPAVLGDGSLGGLTARARFEEQR
jgi:hypothetical protein